MKKNMSYCVLFYLFYCTPITICQESCTIEELFENKNILITGGTGYLGRTLAQEIAKYNPNMIKIISRDEVKLFNSQQLFKDYPNVKTVLGDVRDYYALLKHTKDIDLVIHTAALKRMDALESNVEESIKTNILGSLNLFNACVANKVKKVIFISTDKACSPINIYGGCKFVSEKIFTNYDYSAIETIFTVVRFGNILESTGSVIPILSEKIKNKENIPLTDPKMTRFIIGKDEAVAFIFDAIKYGIGGEIFVKRLPSLNLIDLIDALKEKYHADNPIEIIGLRPGEKIHEVLVNASEMMRTYEFNQIYIITPCMPYWFEQIKLKRHIPVYIANGKHINKNLIKSYSSKKEIISKEEIKEIFQRVLK